MGKASSSPAFRSPFASLVENGAQPESNTLIDLPPRERTRRAVLEVVAPASERCIETTNDVFERDTAGQLGFASDGCVQLVLARPSRITVFVVEHISQELKTGSYHQVRETRFVRMKLQSSLFEQLSELHQRGFGLFLGTAHDHHVVCVTDQGIPCLPHRNINRGEVDVRQ